MIFNRRTITKLLDLVNLQRHNDNYADIQTDLTNHEGRITGAQSDITTHKASTIAHPAEHVTYNGAVTGATNIKEGLDSIQETLDNVIVEGGDGTQAAAAAVSVSGTTYSTLKKRVDEEYLEKQNQFATVNAQLADIVINVKNFGAVGDGITDDTNAIRLAIASVIKGVIYFPAGRYRVTDSCALKSGITIKGASRFTTFIYPDCDLMNAGPETAVKPCFRVSAVSSDITILDIGIDSSHASDTVMASNLFTSGYGITNFSASNILGINMYQLLKFNDCSNMFFDNILCLPPTKVLPVPPENALSFVRCRNITISNVTTHGTCEIIDLSQCINVTITGVIGESAVGDENEAFDIGGCKYVTITNAITNGFGEAVKLKQEGNLPDYLTTEDITISNCQFRGFSKAGIELLTNRQYAEHVIKNISIINCVLQSDVTNSRGLYQIGNANNWGFKNLRMVDCEIKTPNYTVTVANFDGLLLKDNELESSTAAFGGLRFVPIASYPYMDKVKGLRLRGNRINHLAENAAVHIEKIKEVHIEQTTIEAVYSTATNRYAVYMLNVFSPKIDMSKIIGGGYALSINWNDAAYLGTGLTINADVTDTEIKNFGYAGLRINIDFATDVVGPYKMAKLLGNHIHLDNEVVLSGQTGILFRTRKVTDGLDYVKVDNNLIYRVPTPIGFDLATLGANCTQVNNTVYNGA